MDRELVDRTAAVEWEEDDAHALGTAMLEAFRDGWNVVLGPLPEDFDHRYRCFVYPQGESLFDHPRAGGDGDTPQDAIREALQRASQPEE